MQRGALLISRGLFALLSFPDWNLTQDRALIHALTVDGHEKRWQDDDSAVKSANITNQGEECVDTPFVNVFIFRKLDG